MPATTNAKVNTMHKTLNDLSAAKRVAAVAVLNARLADTIDLMHQAKQARWNVAIPGNNYISLLTVCSFAHVTALGVIHWLMPRLESAQIETA